MTESELDQVYTDFCHALTGAGESEATRALCRFALLAMLAIDDAEKIRQISMRAFAGEP
jgi:hypothetical protein